MAGYVQSLCDYACGSKVQEEQPVDPKFNVFEFEFLVPVFYLIFPLTVSFLVVFCMSYRKQNIINNKVLGENKNLQGEIKHLQCQNQQLQNENQQIQNEIYQIQKENYKLQNENQQIQNKNQSLKRSVQSADSETQKSNSLSDELKEDIFNIHLNLKHLMTTIKSYKHLIDACVDFESPKVSSTHERALMAQKYSSVLDDVFQSNVKKIETLQGEIEKLTKMECKAKEERKEFQDFSDQMAKENKELKEQIEKLAKDKQILVDKISCAKTWLTTKFPLKIMEPQSAVMDDRITDIFKQLMDIVKTKDGLETLSIESLPGDMITNQYPVVLPCIAASRVGSDITAALNKSCVGGIRVLLVVYHHIAPHIGKIGMPTAKRLSDPSLLDRCVGIIDLIYWEGRMYECVLNVESLESFVKLLQWNIGLESVSKIKSLLE